MKRLLGILIASGALVGCGRSTPNPLAPSLEFAGRAARTMTPAVGFGELAVSTAIDLAVCLQDTADPRCFNSDARLSKSTLVPPGTMAAPGTLEEFAAASTVTLTWTAPNTGETVTAYNIEAGSAPGLDDMCGCQ